MPIPSNYSSALYERNSDYDLSSGLPQIWELFSVRVPTGRWKIVAGPLTKYGADLYLEVHGTLISRFVHEDSLEIDRPTAEYINDSRQL